ncbi:MAG: ATP-dependent 6-phosphofructokinase [Alphaproteobacteria bacterium]
MKHIGVMTSGGDAPGMNAALRAVVRAGLNAGLQVSGISSGYEGMIDGAIQPLGKRDVGNIIQRGGSILGTSRSKRFLERAHRDQARAHLATAGIEGVVVIGGDGSMKGAKALAETGAIKVVGLPGTIDNDMALVGPTIGFDTAVNTALRAIDNIRDTASTANVVHIVEVMGRHCGWIGLVAGIGGGAEAAVVPEFDFDLVALSARVQADIEAGKQGCIVVLAEGTYPGGGQKLAADLRSVSGCEARLTVLGHTQRGGNPSASDRLLASRLGAAAVEALLDGQSEVVLGAPGDEVQAFAFADVEAAKEGPPAVLYKLVEDLA